MQALSIPFRKNRNIFGVIKQFMLFSETSLLKGRFRYNKVQQSLVPNFMRSFIMFVEASKRDVQAISS